MLFGVDFKLYYILLIILLSFKNIFVYLIIIK